MPGKVSIPGTSGTLGKEKCPVATITWSKVAEVVCLERRSSTVTVKVSVSSWNCTQRTAVAKRTLDLASDWRTRPSM